MAMIQCPECGQSISDQARKCIYCGKELFHCPECGKTTVRTGNLCSNCGYELPAAPPAPASAPRASVAPAVPAVPAATAQSSSAPQPDDIIKVWESDRPEEVKRYKTLNRSLLATWITLFIICGVVFLVLILEAALMLEGSTHISLTTINNAFTALIVFACCASVASFFRDFFSVPAIAKWMKRGTIDVVGYLKEKPITAKNDRAFWAVYYAFSPKGKIIFGINCFLKSISGIEILCIGSLFWKVGKAMIAGDLANLDIWSLIAIPALMFFILLIISMVGRAVTLTSRKKFVESYISQSEQKS